MADSPGPRFGVAALTGTDQMTNYRTMLRAIEDALEAKGFVWRGQGLLSARPAAGVAGGIYRITDTGYEGVLAYDDGAAWSLIGASAAADGPAGTPTLRTLGSGSTQASAGNHSHASDPSAATPGLRTLGTGSTQAAAGDHTHTVAPSAYTACKTANTSRTSTSTLADDPHLTVTIPAGTYSLTMELIGSTANTASNNSFKAQLTATGAGSITYQTITSGTDGASNTDSATLIGTPDSSFLPMTVSGNHFLRQWRGVFTVTGGSITLTLQWAQPNSSSNALVLYGGSFLTVVKQ